MLLIKHIITECDELSSVRKLFSNYLEELNENLCFQDIEEEFANPLKKYGQPKGSLLLALWNYEPVGCIALQPLKENGVCEMKRLYVLRSHRHLKIGEALCIELIEEAKQLGYKKMQLDTLQRLTAAIQLYKKLNFVEVGAYYANPLSGVVYMEKEL
jgi:ribosomal protein S18 acetylase RimI-like enzyme